MNTSIEMVEVSARDGLQNEPGFFPTSDKLELISRAIAAGSKRIEVASFVHPGRVPQMADAEAVCAALPKRSREDVTYIGLTLNKRGALRALETQVHELGSVVCATDGFGTRNQGRTSDETLEDAIEIIRLAKEHGRSAQATISVAFGCPFDGEVSASRVAEIARRLAAAGPREIALGDTIGVAVPNQVKAVVAAAKVAAPGIPIRLHFHDTRNTAVANAWAGVEMGAATLDASIAGIGGCPFAPNATGNVATEDLQYMLQRSGVETGLRLDGLIDAAKWLSSKMGRTLPGLVSRAGGFPK
ncbi:MAG TPA: hydroxymethylglutaryl-CoA lyase [Hyphomonadaceae bacterium]|nr:hydroxymethylglutaryl-CoA lyase [Hyphomonadaceae bacterium]HPN07012.1 hydroxymethylglutaryl-CoA lyase [Hyphomonadaceae bacterium]